MSGKLRKSDMRELLELQELYDTLDKFVDKNLMNIMATEFTPPSFTKKEYELHLPKPAHTCCSSTDFVLSILREKIQQAIDESKLDVESRMCEVVKLMHKGLQDKS